MGKTEAKERKNLLLLFSTLIPFVITRPYGYFFFSFNMRQYREFTPFYCCLQFDSCHDLWLVQSTATQ